MSGAPWERYARQAVPAEAGDAPPWERYAAAPSPEQPGILASAARGLGLGTRAAVQGLAAVPGMAYDVAALPFNAAAAGAEWMGAPAMPRIRSARENVGSVADVVGLPRPTTEGEQTTSGVVEALSGVGSTVGAGMQMANAASPTIAALGRALAAQPATQAASAATGAYVAEETDSPALGIVAGMATPLAIAGARRFAAPISNVNNPGRQALVAAAENEGIPVTAGQATGSRFLQNVESQLEQLPLTAGPQRELREGQNRAFIAAALKRAGVAADDTTPATINAARARIGGTIGAIANRNTMQITPQLDADLQQIEASLRFLTPETATPVRARIEQLRGMASPSAAPNAPPTVPGASYRMLDSELGRSIRNTSDGDVRAALSDLRGRLRAAMDASISPADADEWQQARRQYANLMVIRDAAGQAGAGAAEGMMSPVALRGALDKSTGRGYAYGQGDLNELARIGQALIRPPPDSGTAGRAQAAGYLTGSALTGGGGVMGATMGGPLGGAVGAATGLALPRLAQMLMNSDAGQAYLRRQATPTITPELIRALMLQGTLAAQRPQE